MISNHPYSLIIGLGAVCVAGILTALKLMRNNKILIALLVIGLGMSIAQILISIREHTFTQPTLSDSLHCLLIYVISYNCLRYVYIKAYGIEPTYTRGSWYDFDDDRKQNWFDVFVFVAPVFVSGGFPILLGILKK